MAAKPEMIAGQKPRWNQRPGWACGLPGLRATPGLDRSGRGSRSPEAGGGGHEQGLTESPVFLPGPDTAPAVRVLGEQGWRQGRAAPSAARSGALPAAVLRATEGLAHAQVFAGQV